MPLAMASLLIGLAAAIAFPVMDYLGYDPPCVVVIGLAVIAGVCLIGGIVAAVVAYRRWRAGSGIQVPAQPKRVETTSWTFHGPFGFKIEGPKEVRIEDDQV